MAEENPSTAASCLRRSALHATKPRYRLSQIEELVDRIEAELGNLSEKEVYSKEVGERTMEHLRHFNEVAYVRFASVYRQFKDKSDFVRELEQLTR